jgi:hypothetical protein
MLGKRLQRADKKKRGRNDGCGMDNVDCVQGGYLPREND